MNYLLHLFVMAELYMLIAVSLNLLLGYAGVLQVAHAAYYGIGAYIGAVLTAKFGVGFVPATVLAGVGASALSLLVSVPALRFRGDSFIMMSLAVQAGSSAVFLNWLDVTGGPYGLSGIPKPAIAGIKMASLGSVFATYAIIVSGLVGLVALLHRSPFGRALQAVRDDELAARSVGLPVGRLKLQAFAITSGLVGIAGSMYAAYASYVDPTSFTLDESILMLSMVIVGGTGNLRGPVVGAVTLVFLPEVLRFASLPNGVGANLRLLAYGLLLVVMMRLRPQGLAGRYRFE